MTRISIAVVSYGNKGWPWIEPLRHHHQGCQVIQLLDQTSGQAHDGWRNCDRALRDFWMTRKQEVIGDHVWWVEHDVFCSIHLPECHHVRGMAGKEIAPDGWGWFAESCKLGGLKPVGVVPFGVSVFSRAALDAITDPKWDRLYSDDIFCELRTPSIVQSSLEVSTVQLPFVDWREVKVTEAPGIYHSVKVKG